MCDAAVADEDRLCRRVRRIHRQHATVHDGQVSTEPAWTLGLGHGFFSGENRRRPATAENRAEGSRASEKIASSHRVRKFYTHHVKLSTETPLPSAMR
jgi:hypothetical protein